MAAEGDPVWDELDMLALTGWLRYDGRLYGECAGCGYGPTSMTPFGDALFAMCACCGTRWRVESVTLVGVGEENDEYEDLVYAGLAELARCVELPPRVASAG